MFAEVIVDIAHANVDRLFTYRVPEQLNIKAGHHVLVPFGSGSSPKEGFVLALKESTDASYPLKDIHRILEPYPVLTEEQIELIYWIRQSYHCLLVEALRLMLPAQLRGGRVKEKTERTVTLCSDLPYEEMAASLKTSEGKVKAPKQLEVLSLLHNTGLEMTVSDICAYIPGSLSAINSLVKKNYLLENEQTAFRRPDYSFRKSDMPVSLNAAQKNAVETVSKAFAKQESEVFLLHGVTGSGKTEVYMRCIDRCLKSGKEAIVLVPEISLTPQTVGLFRARFDDDVAVLHSRLSAGERFDEWRRIRLGRARVAVGARSAVFAPFSNLGLIIIDEEHEPSYQSESSPRYHAAEIAAHRSRSFGIPVLLGSATPSLLSYFRAESGRYHLLELPERVMHRPMPSVEVIDMRTEFLSGNNGIFSRRMQELLRDCFDHGHQAMLFLNRRGYSTFVSCRSCGTVIQCPNCDISMTFHKQSNSLKCHFCGASRPVPRLCPNCGKPFIKFFGIGTEQVEEQLHQLFPDVSSLRMDMDTMQHKNSYQQTLSAFASGACRVLIGTQMIAKGHDFPNVTLAGVIAADSSLCIPDYRSTERTFQLLTQIAGRSGRDESAGQVVIQTYSPGHPAIQFAKNHDYKGFYHYELAQRRHALFPPYSMFVRLLFSGQDEAELIAAGERYGKDLEEKLLAHLGEEGKNDLLLFSCSPAPIRKKMNNYRYQILIKLLRTKRIPEVLHLIYDYESEHRNDLFATLEINPQDML